MPMLIGYGSTGLAAGGLLAAKCGLSLAPLWGALTSSMWMSGTMSFAVVPEIADRKPVWAVALLAAAVNFRYAFYGFPLLARWRGAGRLLKAYLVFMLTDENFAVESACRIKDDKQYLSYCKTISLLLQCYWTCGVAAGATAAAILGAAFDAATLQEWTKGMEFSMAAIFIAILADRLREAVRRGR